MEIAGEVRVALPKDVVWEALNSREVLAKATPGCRELMADGEGAYRAIIELGIAMVKGHYEGHLRISERRPPDGYRLALNAAGGPGTVSADLHLNLVADDDRHTRIVYDGVADVQGGLAGLGHGMLRGVGRLIFKDFFKTLAREAKSHAAD